MTPDLNKLRRFALAVGLVLITYSVAAVELDTGETIRPLGLPLKVNRPDLLGIGLVIASLWGMWRFLYYGVWKVETEMRRRGAFLKEIEARLASERKPQFREREQVDKFAEAISERFPRLPGLGIRVASEPVGVEIRQIGGEGGEQVVDSGVKAGYIVRGVRIPLPIRLAARAEDADYFAPIWLNAVALLLWLYRVFVGC